MSHQISTSVKRCKLAGCAQQPAHWRVKVTLDGSEFAATIEWSWPEAMQAAYKARADLDTRLMDEVHESRAARRAAMDRHPAGNARQEPTA